jgi:hypothetical protein
MNHTWLTLMQSYYCSFSWTDWGKSRNSSVRIGQDSNSTPEYDAEKQPLNSDVSCSHSTSNADGRSPLVPIPKTNTRHFRRPGTAMYERLNAFHSPSIITALGLVFLSSVPLVHPPVRFRRRPEHHANLFRTRVSRQRVLEPLSWIIWTPGAKSALSL